MGSSSADMLPIVQRSYDLCAALYEHVIRFPRAQRTLLGRVILDDGLRMLGLLAVANRRREKSETLAEASGHRDALRITVRLGYVSNSERVGGAEQARQHPARAPTRRSGRGARRRS